MGADCGPAIVRRRSEHRNIALLATLARVEVSSLTTVLTDSGHVYLEDIHEEEEAFSPIPNALVIIRRRSSCPRNISLLAEGSMKEIDGYVVRTDVNGYFNVPPKKVKIPRPCNVVMSADVAVPFMRSATAFVAANL